MELDNEFLNKLFKTRNKFLKKDLSQKNWESKIKPTRELNPGDRIEIVWIDRDFTDTGYLFQLPGMDDYGDMLDYFVHIPDPDNSDGIGNADAEFVYLWELLSFKRVKQIIKISCYAN
jgi:hypothetical protein